MGDKYAVRTIRLCEKDCLCLYVCPTGASDTENSVIDAEKCIGCGLCTTRCEFDAIHLSRDIPHAADMHTAEEMKKCVAPYALKRGFKILKTKVTGKSDYPTEQTN